MSNWIPNCGMHSLFKLIGNSIEMFPSPVFHVVQMRPVPFEFHWHQKHKEASFGGLCEDTGPNAPMKRPRSMAHSAAALPAAQALWASIIGVSLAKCSLGMTTRKDVLKLIRSLACQAMALIWSSFQRIQTNVSKLIKIGNSGLIKSDIKL